MSGNLKVNNDIISLYSRNRFQCASNCFQNCWKQCFCLLDLLESTCYPQMFSKIIFQCFIATFACAHILKGETIIYCYSIITKDNFSLLKFPASMPSTKYLLPASQCLNSHIIHSLPFSLIEGINTVILHVSTLLKQNCLIYALIC